MAAIPRERPGDRPRRAGSGDPAPRERLLGVLKNDVQRLDRLVTDISNASRLDAELSRDNPKPIDLERLVSEVVSRVTWPVAASAR